MVVLEVVEATEIPVPARMGTLPAVLYSVTLEPVTISESPVPAKIGRLPPPVLFMVMLVPGT